MKKYCAYALALLLITGGALAASETSVKQNNPKIRAWNSFATNLLDLHKKVITTGKVTKKSKTGGYVDMPQFYLEESYHDEQGRLLSLIQWVSEKPDQLHSLEVYIYDAAGKLQRDYAVTYLPYHHNSPIQTLITLHGHNGEYHAFRTFDASGDRIFERCEKDEAILFNLDEDRLYAALEGRSKIMKEEPYPSCFKGIPDKAGEYLTPH